MRRTNPADFLPGQHEYNGKELARLRTTPDRANGEAEARAPLSDYVKDSQLLQTLTGRGGVGDINADIFKEPTNASYALLDNEYALSEVEYHNRKLQLLAGNADFDGNALSGMSPFIGGYHNVPKMPAQGTGRINPHMMRQLVGPRHPDITDEPDGTNLNRRPLMTPFPGFPIDELVNLPRFIMADLSPFAFVNEPQYVPKNLQLPYPKILFELGPEDDKHLVVVRQAGFSQAIAVEYLHTDRTTPFLIGSMAHAEVNQDGTMDITVVPYSTDAEIANRCVHAVIGFIAEFSIGNTIIGTQTRDPNRVIPPAGTTRKYRIVRLVMGVTKVCKPWQGGTHASPREHERMGHWRRVKGEPRWFPAVTVNKGVIGRVMKAYHVSKRNAPVNPDLQDKGPTDE